MELKINPEFMKCINKLQNKYKNIVYILEYIYIDRFS